MRYKGLLYNGFTVDIIERFQRAFDEMRVVHNFEHGEEFEMAICEVLQRLLPGRAGICRGYVVGKDGTEAGDDIVIFDTARFPTLRSLGGNFGKKEHVPAEAVLAYIEAKHTLHIGGNGGQSLEYACQQAGKIKLIHRDPVPLTEVAPGVHVGPGFTVTESPGFPSIRNPWFTAIFARHVDVDKSYKGEGHYRAKSANESVEHWSLDSNVRELEQKGVVLPDVIAGSDIVSMPIYLPQDNPTKGSIRPFLTSATKLFAADVPEVGLGVGTLQLLWAMEFVALGEIPWSSMIFELASLSQWAAKQAAEETGAQRDQPSRETR